MTIRNSLVGRMGANASRQAIGALLFFFTTLFLTASMGSVAYASYFGAWNAAQIVVVLTSLGLYADTIRRLVEGDPARDVARALAIPYLTQIIFIIVASVAFKILTGQSGLLVGWIAMSTAFSNALTAVALGKDWFWRFASGELLQNAALFVLVWLVAPQQPETVGYLFAGSTLCKALWYLCAPARDGEGATPTAVRLEKSRGYAAFAYGHSLLQIASYRGIYIIAERLLGPVTMATIALVWAFCDRSLLLVQGVNQVLLPRLMARTVSEQFIRRCTIGCVMAFVVVATGMLATWSVLGVLGLVKAQPLEIWVAIALPLGFVPLVVGQIRMTVLLAQHEFRRLIAAHVSACSALTITAACAVISGWHSPAVACLLLFSVGLAALPPLYVGRQKINS